MQHDRSWLRLAVINLFALVLLLGLYTAVYFWRLKTATVMTVVELDVSTFVGESESTTFKLPFVRRRFQSSVEEAVFAPALWIHDRVQPESLNGAVYISD